MGKRWLVFGVTVSVIGVILWAVLSRIPAPVPDPSCDPANLPSSYTMHLTDMRGWLLVGNVSLALGAAIAVVIFLYLQLSHSWPTAARYATSGVVVLLTVLAAGLLARQSAVGWARATAGTCLTEALNSPQAANASLAGAVTGLPNWETGVFVDASTMCAIGVAFGILVYLVARRVARA